MARDHTRNYTSLTDTTGRSAGPGRAAGRTRAAGMATKDESSTSVISERMYGRGQAPGRMGLTRPDRRMGSLHPARKSAARSADPGRFRCAPQHGGQDAGGTIAQGACRPPRVGSPVLAIPRWCITCVRGARGGALCEFQAWTSCTCAASRGGGAPACSLLERAPPPRRRMRGRQIPQGDRLRRKAQNAGSSAAGTATILNPPRGSITIGGPRTRIRVPARRRSS